MLWMLINLVYGICPAMEIIAHPKVKSKSIVETSGLAFHKDLLWLHNDSGDKAQLFSIDIHTYTTHIHRVPVSKAIDWEDITIDRDQNTLYIADTGDNRETRKNARIVSYNISTKEAKEIPISYETGAIDVEGIAFDPVDKKLILISKGRGGTVHLFHLDPNTYESEPLASLNSFSISSANGLNPERITAMSISPDGSYIAIRNYVELFLWPREKESSIIESMKTKPCTYVLPAQKQGESLAFANNHQLWTLSEGKKQPLFEIRLLHTDP